MIRATQKPYKMPIGAGGGGGDTGPFALFQQRYQAVFANEWLSPWVEFDAGNLTECFGYCNTGTFTAEIYIDGIKVFDVTQANISGNPASLVTEQTGLLAEPSLIECKITAASTDVKGIFIEAK